MSAVLVDTSVWVQHFRQCNAALADLLVRDGVLMHPLVTGELACGTPPRRPQTLADLQDLQQAQQATVAEAMAFVERERLYGQGCGLVDMLLLTSTLMTKGAKLWTLDKRLGTLAQRFGVAHAAPVH